MCLMQNGVMQRGASWECPRISDECWVVGPAGCQVPGRCGQSSVLYPVGPLCPSVFTAHGHRTSLACELDAVQAPLCLVLAGGPGPGAS